MLTMLITASAKTLQISRVRQGESVVEKRWGSGGDARSSPHTRSGPPLKIHVHYRIFGALCSLESSETIISPNNPGQKTTALNLRAQFDTKYSTGEQPVDDTICTPTVTYWLYVSKCLALSFGESEELLSNCNIYHTHSLLSPSSVSTIH